MAAHTHPTPHRPRWNRRLTITTSQLAVLTLTLAAWQYLPHITWLRKQSPIFDPFFVSSPEAVWHRLGALGHGSNGQPAIWSSLAPTLEATFLGVAIGAVAGAMFGVVLSHSPRASAIMRPFLSVLNTTPRIALIPIFIIIAGATLTTSVIVSVTVTFFLIFWNAYSGGRSVRREMIQNAQLLGASNFEIMRQIRFPYVIGWTFASLPNAISLGLSAVVAAEFLTGQKGLGLLLNTSISTIDATLTFSIVVILVALGVSLVVLTNLVSRRLLHWWVDAAK
jgi:NitT/TauT family transport system permease protein